MDRLSAVLERSRALGLLGPGDVEGHRAHAMGFVRAWGSLHVEPPATFCDLGAGGGVPGLILALEWRDSTAGLLEASARRCQFLREAAGELGLGGRVTVHEGRVEALARSEVLEGGFQLVTARSFGPPAATAECAVRLLGPDGVLLVAEPPAGTPGDARWPTDGLGQLGLRLEGSTEEPCIAVLRRIGPLAARFPRRDGVPFKRPLF